MRTQLTSAALLLLASPVLFAHPGHGALGFAAGAAHPLDGLDHLLAMVAVGLLGVRCASGAHGDRHALWQVPAAFMGMLVVGGLLAVSGLPLPAAEWGIALSVLIFGVLVALGNAPRTWVACVVAGGFALLHGQAHAAEIAGSSMAAYCGGVLLTTAVLHAAGLTAGWSLTSALSQAPVRVAGGGVALASGVVFYGLVVA